MASGANIAKAYVQIMPSFEGGAKKIAEQLGGEKAGSEAGDKIGKGLSDSLSKAAKVAGAATAAAVAATATALGALVKKSVQGFAEYEQLIGGVETLFKSAAPQIEAYADVAYKTAGLSANAYMETVTGFSASLISSLGGDTVKAAEIGNMAVIDMSDNANKMGSSIESIQMAYNGFAKQNYTMLDNLKIGYGGTKGEMERLLRDAEKLPEAMGRKFDLNNYADVVTAIHLVQTEWGITGTTASEAEQTISGSIGMLKGSFDNLITGMAKTNASIDALVADVANSVTAVMNNVMPVITRVIDAFPILFDALAAKIVDMLPPILNAVVGLADKLLSTISSLLPKIVAVATDILIKVVQTILQQLPNILDAGMQIVTVLIDGIAKALPALIYQAANIIKSLVDAIISNLPQLLNAALNVIQALVDGILIALPVLIAALPQIITSIVDFIVTAIPMIMDAATKLFTGLINAIPVILPQIIEALPQIIETIVGGLIEAIPILLKTTVILFGSIIEAIGMALPGIIKSVGSIIVAIVKGIADGIQPMINKGVELLRGLVTGLGNGMAHLLQFLGTLPSRIISGLGSLAGTLISAGIDLIQGLKNGIINAASNLANVVLEPIKNAVSAVKSFLRIQSPSRLMAEIGGHTVDGFSVGVEAATPRAAASTKKMAENAYVEVEKFALPKKFMTLAQYAGDQFANGITASSDKMESAFSDFQSKLDTALNDAQAAVDKAHEKLANHVKGAERELKASELLLTSLKGAQDALTQSYEAHAGTLNGLHTQYDDLTELLKDMQAELKAASDEANKLADNVTKAFTAQLDFTKLTLFGTVDGDALTAAGDRITAANDKVWDTSQSLIDAQEALLTAQNASITADQIEKLSATELAREQDKLTREVERKTVALERAQRAHDAATVEVDRATTALSKLEAQGGAATSAIDMLKQSVADTKAFEVTMNTLVGMGITSTSSGREIYEALAQAGTGAYEFAKSIEDGGREGLGKLVYWYKQDADAAEQFGRLISSTTRQGGIDAMQAIIDGTESKRDAVGTQINDLTTGIIDTVVTKFGISDGGSVLAHGWGKDIGTGLEQGMAAKKDDLTKMAGNFSDTIQTRFKDAMRIKSPSQAMADFGKHTGQGLIDGMAAKKNAIGENATKLAATVLTAIKDKLEIKGGVSGAMFELGKNAGQGIIDGLESMATALTTVAQGLADTITGTITAALQIQSPSRVMAAIGGHIVDGLAVGIGGGAGSVIREMNTLNNSIAAAVKPRSAILPDHNTASATGGMVNSGRSNNLTFNTTSVTVSDVLHALNLADLKTRYL